MKYNIIQPPWELWNEGWEEYEQETKQMLKEALQKAIKNNQPIDGDLKELLKDYPDLMRLCQN